MATRRSCEPQDKNEAQFERGENPRLYTRFDLVGSEGAALLIHELTAAECRDVLWRAKLGRLACAKDDQPYVVPIQLSYDALSDALYAFSTVGQKIEWMRTNPKVCVEIEEITDKSHWTTVVVFGTYEEIHESAQ